MLLEDALKEFIFECEIKKYTWKTIKGYRNGLEFLINYLQQKHNLTEIEEVHTRHLKAYFVWQSRRGRKGIYMNGLLKTFQSFLSII